MKKILLSLFILLIMAGYSQQRLIDAKKINVRELLYSNGTPLIYPGDSVGQFDYDNVEDPVLDLDAVNLRTLRRWFANYLDTVIVGLDTFVTLPPDTFLNAYGNSWLHSGQTIEHPPLDTFYVEWSQEWISCGETIPSDQDSIYIDSLDIMICNNCYIVTDTTNFYVKRSSCNYNCWTYSFDGVTWLPWFCLPEIEPETKLYIFAKDSNLLNVYHRLYYSDSDSIGYKNNSHYIDKWLYYGADSIYWRQSPDSLFKGGNWYNLPDTIPNDSLFMDGVWYNLPDTLPINVDSLIYVNNVPISIGDTIFTHDSIYYNGVWVQNDTIHIVDNSITNERDSIYISNHLAWYGNRDTLNINDADYLTTNELDSIYVIERSVWYTNSDTLSINDADYNPLNEKDSIQINGTWLSNGESISIPILWTDTYNGINTTQKIGVGTLDANDNAMIYTDIQGDSIAFLVEKYGSGDYVQFKDREDSTYFSIDSLGGIHSMGLNYPRVDGDNLQIIGTDGNGNLSFIDQAFKRDGSGYSYVNDGSENQSSIGIGSASSWLYGLSSYYSRSDYSEPNAYFSAIKGRCDYPYANGVWGVSEHGKGVWGYTDDYIGVLGQCESVSTGYSGYFHGGLGMYADTLLSGKIISDSISTDKLTVGDSTVTTIRSGATFTIWQGTQAAYDAIGTKDAKTIYYIEQNFNVLQILFFLLMFFGSRGVFGQSNWAAVNIGTSEMKKIYVGEKLVWEKGGKDTTLVMTMATTSTSATWSPQTVTKTGATLHWEVTGAVTTSANINDPTFNFSTAGTKYIKVTASDGAGGLTRLYCYYNDLTTLDVSSCINLSYLYCYSNQLTTLDVSNNTNLLRLYCYSNQLTTLDVSNCVNLLHLYCYSNQLTTLDVSNNTNLSDLNCDSNQLTTLDVSNNTNLSYLNCSSNQLTTLDVSNNTNLLHLYCYSNQLTTTTINSILDNLILFGIDGQYFYCDSQTPPASPDLSKVAALRALGWNVVY